MGWPLASLQPVIQMNVNNSRDHGAELQVLDAADHHPSPWLGSWTVLAAATGARNGELCGLEWADLNLDAGTIRFRQALTIVAPAVLPDAAPGDSEGDGDASGVGARRKERHCCICCE
jgi:integrase